MEDLQKKIQELKAQLDGIHRAERYRQELERKRSAHQQKLESLRQHMEKESQDIKALEQWSIKELFVKVINKEEQLEKEKEEYLQAAIAYQDAKKEQEMLDFEIEILRNKEANRKKIITELQALYDQRESEILNNQPDHPLKPVLEEMARWNQIDRELEEAIQHGGEAQLLLEAIAQNLIRAKSWAYNSMRELDHRLRMIAQEIDEARLRLPKLRMEFVKFEQEIKEVFQYPELKSWQHDQYNGLQQVQTLVRDLGSFTQEFIRGFTYHQNLPHQLHRTHTVADNLHHQTATSVKWLRLEQLKAQKEVERLENVKQALLG